MQKVRFYLAHPQERDRIAANGHRRTRGFHTYDRRFEDLLGLTMQRFATRRGAVESKPVDTLPKPRLGRIARIARVALLFACKRIWGPNRGTRAARRITFEVSLKVFGARTFTAAGLPGRMFPYV